MSDVSAEWCETARALTAEYGKAQATEILAAYFDWLNRGDGAWLTAMAILQAAFADLTCDLLQMAAEVAGAEHELDYYGSQR